MARPDTPAHDDYGALLDALGGLEGRKVLVTISAAREQEAAGLIVAFSARLGKLRIGQEEREGGVHALASVPFLDADTPASINVNGDHLRWWEKFGESGLIALFEPDTVLQLDTYDERTAA